MHIQQCIRLSFFSVCSAVLAATVPYWRGTDRFQSRWRGRWQRAGRLVARRVTARWMAARSVAGAARWLAARSVHGGGAAQPADMAARSVVVQQIAARLVAHAAVIAAAAAVIHASWQHSCGTVHLYR